MGFVTVEYSVGAVADDKPEATQDAEEPPAAQSPASGPTTALVPHMLCITAAGVLHGTALRTRWPGGWSSARVLSVEERVGESVSRPCIFRGRGSDMFRHQSQDSNSSGVSSP
mmetsp:Transcript_94420/g.266727  ORF Transcript_94420/g.266727 Transcript_94420/m.266727 type:complete len:113 (+) Transcript_94420:964-1302(+)